MEAMEAGTLVAEKYRLVRIIGRGGMGAVWAAQNVRTEREVALKLITDENLDYCARLLREARACGRISHRNVIEIYDVGELASGAPFLVMPLLEGEPLSRRLRRERVLPPAIAAQIAAEISRALAAAHAAGIVHRDLKPANVYLHREPGADSLVVKVLDFGISKVVTHDSTTTTTGTILGSPAYMSPEQAKGERYVDSRSDLWAVGVTLFEMLTGQRPFQGESMFTVVAAVLSGHIPHVLDLAPHVDPGLADVVALCMQRDLASRVQTADEIAYLLRPYAAGYLPLDLQSFSASGFLPAPNMAPPGTTGANAIESASVPPVHFAAHAGPSAQALLQARAAERVPPPRAPMPSFPSITTISVETPAPFVMQPEPFSGSTTAAGSMVHPDPAPRPAPVEPAHPFAPPPGLSRRAMWILGTVAFVSVAALVGTAIGVVASGPAGAPNGSGVAATGPSAAITITSAPPATASPAPRPTDAPTATTALAPSGSAPSTAATPDPTPPPTTTAPRPSATTAATTPTAKPTTSAKTGKGGKGGVSVPDDPG